MCLLGTGILELKIQAVRPAMKKKREAFRKSVRECAQKVRKQFTNPAAVDSSTPTTKLLNFLGHEKADYQDQGATVASASNAAHPGIK